MGVPPTESIAQRHVHVPWARSKTHWFEAGGLQDASADASADAKAFTEADASTDAGAHAKTHDEAHANTYVPDDPLANAHAHALARQRR